MLTAPTGWPDDPSPLGGLCPSAEARDPLQRVNGNSEQSGDRSGDADGTQDRRVRIPHSETLWPAAPPDPHPLQAGPLRPSPHLLSSLPGALSPALALGRIRDPGLGMGLGSEAGPFLHSRGSWTRRDHLLTHGDALWAHLAVAIFGFENILIQEL